MKASVSALRDELKTAESVLGRTTRKERDISAEKQALANGHSRIKRELYDRIWTGETTGDVLEDIIIATKGAPDEQALAGLRALMRRFIVHEGQFVAGRHRGVDDFYCILVGVVGSGPPVFCHAKSEIILPIKPAVSFDSDWQWGFANIAADSWRIKLDKREMESRGRCWALEQLWQDVSAIHVGDTEVWDFLMNVGRHKYGPVVTFAHIASALGRPLGRTALGAKTEPLVGKIRDKLPDLVEAQRSLRSLSRTLPSTLDIPLLKDTCEELRDGLRDASADIVAIRRFLRHLTHPHRIKAKKQT